MPVPSAPLPSLRQLRYLCAVVEERHFGRAAEACSVTQSTLSAGIQELEALLGLALLERNRRHVRPTVLGAELAEAAARILQAVHDLTQRAAAARAPMTGPFRLGAIPTIGPFLLPQVLPELRQRFPALQLYLREDLTARLVERMEAGVLDAALVALPFADAGLTVLPLAQDPFWVVCPQGHRLGAATMIATADITVEDLLLLEDGHCLRDHALAACALDSARHSAGFQSTSLAMLVQMVASGLGVTLIPNLAREAGLLNGLPVVARPLADHPRATRGIGLVWRRGAGQEKTCRALADVLLRSLTKKRA